MSRINYAKVNTFADELGRQIRIFAPQGSYETAMVDGKSLKPKTIIKGVAMVRVQHQGRPPEEVPFEFVFPDAVKDVQGAFDVFDVEMQKAIKDAQAKARVIPAKSMPKILGPDGRPMGG